MKDFKVVINLWIEDNIHKIEADKESLRKIKEIMIMREWEKIEWIIEIWVNKTLI